MPPRLADPIIAIVGATATGKTALAVNLASAIKAEIISADSRQVYRGMDIGTAKPSPAELAAARHWLIDVVAPDEPFSLADFLDRATAAIDDIEARGKRVILAGGTGQYVRALLEGWRVPRVPANHVLRGELEALAEARGAAAVRAELEAADPVSADRIGGTNVRRMIRAIEVTRATGVPFSAWQDRRDPPRDAVVVGLRLSRDVLYTRIDDRVDAMMRAGLLDEVRGLVAQGYDCDLPSMSGIGYRQVCEHLAGVCSLEDAIARIKTETHRLGRTQHAWFRPADSRIRWLDADSPCLLEDALAFVAA